MVTTFLTLTLHAKGPNLINHPYPQHTLYTKDTIAPTNYPQATLDQQVISYYEQWKKEFLIALPQTKKSSYRIAFGKPGSKKASSTVSEGQGYGMIITVLMAGYDNDAQKTYDSLLHFVKENPSKKHNGLMAWRVNGTEVEGSAFDGDADIAYSLLMADKQWGSSGKVNYHLEAEILLENIYKSVIGPYSKLPMLGDWIDYDAKTHNQFSVRSSDLMLSNFYNFSKLDGRWNHVLNRSITVIKQLQDDHSPQAHLLPDFFISKDYKKYEPATKDFLEGPFDGAYYYNACRAPLRIGIYTLLHGDKSLSSRLQQLSLWLEKNSDSKIDKIHAGYYLSGKPLPHSSYEDTLFTSTFGVAAMHSPTQQRWLNNIYERVYQKHINYYEDSVTLLSLLVMSGNYWD